MHFELNLRQKKNGDLYLHELPKYKGGLKVNFWNSQDYPFILMFLNSEEVDHLKDDSRFVLNVNTDTAYSGRHTQTQIEISRFPEKGGDNFLDNVQNYRFFNPYFMFSAVILQNEGSNTRICLLPEYGCDYFATRMDEYFVPYRLTDPVTEYQHVTSKKLQRHALADLGTLGHTLHQMQATGWHFSGIRARDLYMTGKDSDRLRVYNNGYCFHERRFPFFAPGQKNILEKNESYDQFDVRQVALLVSELIGGLGEEGYDQDLNIFINNALNMEDPNKRPVKPYIVTNLVEYFFSGDSAKKLIARTLMKNFVLQNSIDHQLDQETLQRNIQMIRLMASTDKNGLLNDLFPDMPNFRGGPNNVVDNILDLLSMNSDEYNAAIGDTTEEYLD